MSQCTQCEGSGQVTHASPSMTSGRSMAYDCPLCQGRGVLGFTSLGKKEAKPEPKQWPRYRGPKGKVNARATKAKRKAQRKARRGNR